MATKAAPTKAAAAPAKAAAPAPKAAAPAPKSTPVPTGTFNTLTTSSAVGKTTILGQTSPAYSSTLVGPVVAGQTLTDPNFVATPQPTTTVVKDAKGNVVGYNTVTYNWDGSANTPTYSSAGDVTVPTGPSTETRDAFATMTEVFTSYGLGDLASTFQTLMTQGKSANEALMLVKYDPAYNAAYTARFAGNKTRLANGLNALSEAAYIANENAYADTLKAYGLGNMLSTDRKTNEAQFATYIGNDVSSTEFASRIKTASDNVINADPVVMKTFQQYYGHALTTSDVVAYFLAPTESLPVLQSKVAAAQVGTAATEQGLNVAADRANVLAQQMGGYGQLGNIAGAYQNVASVLPTGQKLSDIYQQAGINYDQTTAENEYLLSNADAQQKRKQLASLERAQFGGDSGVNPTMGNLASARTVQGKF
jgi:hypothetical protein